MTTVEVRTIQDAIERVTWYACRWGIEVWHRILKSGCRIEERQLATGERLQRCLTLYSVIAWRVFYATMLARAVPEMSCSVLLEIEEWQALYCAIHACPAPPEIRLRLTKLCAGSRSSAGLWVAVAATNLGLRRCGVACNI